MDEISHRRYARCDDGGCQCVRIHRNILCVQLPISLAGSFFRSGFFRISRYPLNHFGPPVLNSLTVTRIVRTLLRGFSCIAEINRANIASCSCACVLLPWPFPLRSPRSPLHLLQTRFVVFTSPARMIRLPLRKLDDRAFHRGS